MSQTAVRPLPLIRINTGNTVTDGMQAPFGPVRMNSITANQGVLLIICAGSQEGGYSIPYLEAAPLAVGIAARQALWIIRWDISYAFFPV
ncbi:MAG: hypothetical protein DPW09_07010 [Anaerolineae bacterium]|nr:hypothetical protein [Anaerolineae bacterium]